MSNKIQRQIMNGRALTAGTIASVGVVLIMALVVVFNSFTVVDAGT